MRHGATRGAEDDSGPWPRVRLGAGRIEKREGTPVVIGPAAGPAALADPEELARVDLEADLHAPLDVGAYAVVPVGIGILADRPHDEPDERAPRRERAPRLRGPHDQREPDGRNDTFHAALPFPSSPRHTRAIAVPVRSTDTMSGLATQGRSALIGERDGARVSARCSVAAACGEPTGNPIIYPPMT